MQMESLHLCKMEACCESLEKTYIFLPIITILGSREGFQGNLATGAFMWSVCDYLLCQANGCMSEGGVGGSTDHFINLRYKNYLKADGLVLLFFCVCLFVGGVFWGFFWCIVPRISLLF